MAPKSTNPIPSISLADYNQEQVSIPLTAWNEVTREEEVIMRVYGTREMATARAKEVLRLWNMHGALKGAGVENVAISVEGPSVIRVTADADLPVTPKPR